MVDWLEKFAQNRVKKMKKTAGQMIVDKENFPNAKDGDVVDYEDERCKVVNSKYSDDKGEGLVLERCAELEGDPMDVEMGTATDFSNSTIGSTQEYAYNDPQIQDEDPRDEEVRKFNEDADATAAAIDAENAIDGTSGATRPNRILQRMLDNYSNSMCTDTTCTEDTMDMDTDVDVDIDTDMDTDMDMDMDVDTEDVAVEDMDDDLDSDLDDDLDLDGDFDLDDEDETIEASIPEDAFDNIKLNKSARRKFNRKKASRRKINKKHASIPEDAFDNIKLNDENDVESLSDEFKICSNRISSRMSK